MNPLTFDNNDLAVQLSTLGSVARLELLRQLTKPRPLGQIIVHGESGQPIARQAVREHLDRLVETGFVVAQGSSRDARSPLEYVIDHQCLFVLSEAIRGLSRMRPLIEPSLPTQALSELPAKKSPDAPALVIVKGLEEGVSFLLQPTLAPTRGWIIGRKRDAWVSLDFDPFISAENSRIEMDGGRHLIEDLPQSRNGTTLNFQPIIKGRRVQLCHGDVIGVGRTLLVYRAGQTRHPTKS